jgi:hypothetical protein
MQKQEMKSKPSTAEKVSGKGVAVHRLVSSLWGLDGWSVMHHAPCKNGRIWIVTDCKRDVWDLVKWDRNEWTSERGIEMNMTHCKPLSIGANEKSPSVDA